MEKTRFGEIISAFSVEDFKELQDFAVSPVFNTNKQVAKLAELLFAVKEEKGSIEIQKEEIWKYVYTAEKYNDDKYLKLTSDFVKLAEKYLIYKKNESDAVRKKMLLLESFREMNLEKNFSKYYKELEKHYDKEFNRTPDYFMNKYSFLSESLLFNHTGGDFNLPAVLEELNKTAENAFLLMRLDHMIQLHINTDEGINKEANNAELNSIEKNLKSIQKESPIAYGKYLVFKMLSSENSEEYFSRLKKFVSDAGGKLNKSYLSFFYDKLLLFCGFGDGNSDLQNEELEIHKVMDAKGLIPTEGTYLGYNYFLKTVDCALNLGELEWAEKFIKKYGGKLSPELAEDTVNLAKADVYIYLKKFDDALNPLSRVDNHNYYFYLAKNLKTIIIYYEQGKKDAAAYAIDAVKHYLTRNKQTIGSLYNYYNNFLNFTSRLVRITNPINRDSIKNDLVKVEEVANRLWLENRLGIR